MFRNVRSILTLALLIFSTSVQIRVYFVYRSEDTRKILRSLKWLEHVRLPKAWEGPVINFGGIMWASQFWSCLAALFYITVNVMIMVGP